VTLDYVLDEGMIVADGFLPGVRSPVAMIGTAEKGWSTLESNPMPATITPPVAELFACVAPEMPFVRRVVFANLPLFEPLVRRQLARYPATNALVRTTGAVTMARGGTKDNVLPASATAVVSFCVLPGESTASVIDYVRRVVDNPKHEPISIDSYTALIKFYVHLLRNSSS